MTIISETNRIKNNISDAYDALEEKGAVMPTSLNSNNLASTINSISGGGTTNHAQLTNLDFANSGHTGFMSNSSYIPANTTYNIKADGTGDFATITDALEFLKGKWSDGKVILRLNAGSHTFMSTSSSEYTYSGMHGSGDMLIRIEGASKDTTIVDLAGKNLCMEFANVVFYNIQLYDSTHATSAYNQFLLIRYGSNVTFQNVKFVNSGVQIYKSATALFDYGNEIHNTGSGIMTSYGGKTIITNDILCKDVNYCFCVDFGGHVSLGNTQLNYKNVTKYFGLWRTDAHFSKTGVIYSGTGDGIICGYLTATQVS